MDKDKQDEGLYQTLVENTLDYIYLIDPDYKIIAVNSSASRALHLPPEKIIGRSITELFPPEVAKGYTRSIRRVLDSGEPFSSQSSRMIVNGVTTWLSVTLSPVKDAKDNVLSVIGVSHDITKEKEAEEELKISERKYHNLVDNVPGMIYIGRPDWSAEIIKGSEELCGFPIDDFNSGSIKWSDLIHPDDAKRIMEEGVELAQKPKMVTQEYRIICCDKKIKYVTDIKLSSFEDGKFTGVYGIVFDVTEKKELETELKQKYDELEKMNKIMLGRELKMAEMKKEIADLELRLTRCSDAK